MYLPLFPSIFLHFLFSYLLLLVLFRLRVSLLSSHYFLLTCFVYFLPPLLISFALIFSVISNNSLPFFILSNFFLRRFFFLITSFFTHYLVSLLRLRTNFITAVILCGVVLGILFASSTLCNVFTPPVVLRVDLCMKERSHPTRDLTRRSRHSVVCPRCDGGRSSNT